MAETDFVTLLQRTGDCVKNGVDGLAGLRLSDPRPISDDADQIVLVHSVSSQ